MGDLERVLRQRDIAKSLFNWVTVSEHGQRRVDQAIYMLIVREQQANWTAKAAKGQTCINMQGKE